MSHEEEETEEILNEMVEIIGSSACELLTENDRCNGLNDGLVTMPR